MTALPSLQQMRFLCAVAGARLSSKGRIAETCAVAQSTLGAGIQELENRLGGIACAEVEAGLLPRHPARGRPELYGELAAIIALSKGIQPSRTGPDRPARLSLVAGEGVGQYSPTAVIAC